MLIEFFIAAARSVPDTGNVSMAPERAKSNLEEGLIQELVPLENAFERAKKSKKDGSIGITRGDLACDLGALYKISADGKIGRRRTGAIALLKRAVAAIEARDHLIAPFPGRSFGFDQSLRLVSPLLAFIRTANGAQEMQRAENFGKPLQVAVIGGGRVLRRSLSRRRRLTGLTGRDWPGLRLGLRLRRKRPELLLRLKLRLTARLRLRRRQAENLCAGGSGAQRQPERNNDCGSEHRGLFTAYSSAAAHAKDEHAAWSGRGLRPGSNALTGGGDDGGKAIGGL
jgi:hypothetical protein